MSLAWKKRVRQEKILSSLDKLGFATRSQLQKIHELGTDRNALWALNNMKEYLHIKRHSERNLENVYFLNQKGRELIGSDKERKYSLEVEHYLLRNDIYIHFGCPRDFEIEKEIAFTSGLKQKIIKPDARFTQNGVYHLVEIDRTQNMGENKNKIAQYAELSPLIKEQYKQFPSLIFYTITPTRKQSLSALCKEKGIQFKVISKQDIV